MPAPMEQQDPPEFILDVFSDPCSVRDVVKGHITALIALLVCQPSSIPSSSPASSPALTPRTRDVLDLTLPYVDDDELETMIDQRVSALERQLDAERVAAANMHHNSSHHNHHHPHQLHQPHPARHHPAYHQHAPADAAASSSGGGTRGQVAVQFFEKRRRKAWLSRADDEVCWESWTVKVTVAEPRTETERAKVRRAMEQTLLTTAMKIVTLANAHKDYIPPITTQGGNPFLFKIKFDHKETGWAARMRIY